MNRVPNFLKDNERSEIISFVNSINFDYYIKNKHIENISSKLNGDSWMFDISKTDLSKKLSNYQSSNNVLDLILPEIIINLKDRISKELNISDKNVFLQILNQESGGTIHPHYDSAIDGYITYKCNIPIITNSYNIYIGDNIFNINESDLYSFESSLYKHWTDKFNSKRVLLSFGFILRYEELGRDVNDPRVRLSKRLIKYFQ